LYFIFGQRVISNTNAIQYSVMLAYLVHSFDWVWIVMFKCLYNFMYVIEFQKDPVPDDYDCRDPEHKTIYRFIRTLFNAAQLTAECAIVTLVSFTISYILYVNTQKRLANKKNYSRSRLKVLILDYTLKWFLIWFLGISREIVDICWTRDRPV